MNEKTEPRKGSFEKSSGGEDPRVLRAMLAEAQVREEQLAARLSELERSSAWSEPVPLSELPLYELTAPFYAPDDQYFPAGVQFRDLTGDLVPNETMIPLNAAAEDRLVEYLNSLPLKGALNGAEELIIQAAYEMRQQEFASPEARNAAVLERATKIKYGREGRLMSQDPRANIRIPHRLSDAPIMSNVRVHQIQEEDRFGGDYRGRFMPGGARPTSKPVGSRTSMAKAAVSAAEKPAPVFGTMQSQSLGNVGPGVQAG